MKTETTDCRSANNTNHASYHLSLYFLGGYLFLNKYLHTPLALVSHSPHKHHNRNDFEYSLAQIIISHRKKTYNACPSTHYLPAQLPSSVLPISTKPQPRTQRYNRNCIPNKDRIVTISLKPASVFLCFGLGFLLRFGGLFFAGSVGFFGSRFFC